MLFSYPKGLGALHITNKLKHMLCKQRDKEAVDATGKPLQESTALFDLTNIVVAAVSSSADDGSRVAVRPRPIHLAPAAAL